MIVIPGRCASIEPGISPPHRPVIPRAGGVSSTPRLFRSIADNSEYWIARLRGRRRPKMWRVRTHQIRLHDRYGFTIPRRDAPEALRQFPPRGRGECRVPDAPTAPCAEKKHTGRSRRFTGNHPAFPHAAGFNDLLRALPGDEFVLPPSSANGWHVRARSGRPASANLTPATGARTTRLHRPHQRRSSVAPLVAHEPEPALQPRSRPTLPRPPHPIPTSVTIAIRPSLRDETAAVVVLIWGRREAKYFYGEDWTGQIALKSLEKIAPSRMRCRRIPHDKPAICF